MKPQNQQTSWQANDYTMKQPSSIALELASNQHRTSKNQDQTKPNKGQNSDDVKIIEKTSCQFLKKETEAMNGPNIFRITNKTDCRSIGP